MTKGYPEKSRSASDPITASVPLPNEKKQTRLYPLQCPSQDRLRGVGSTASGASDLSEYTQKQPSPNQEPEGGIIQSSERTTYRYVARRRFGTGSPR